jgi:hypothetical protein
VKQGAEIIGIIGYVSDLKVAGIESTIWHSARCSTGIYESIVVWATWVGSMGSMVVGNAPTFWDIEDVDSVYRLVSDFTGKNTNRQSNDFLTFAPSARLVLEMRNNEQNAGSRGQEANTAFACGRFLADHRERSQSDSIDSIEIGNPLPDETAITMQ